MFQKEKKIKCFQMVQNHVVGTIGKCFSARTIVLIIPQGYSAMIYTIYTIDVFPFLCYIYNRTALFFFFFSKIKIIYYLNQEGWLEIHNKE